MWNPQRFISKDFKCYQLGFSFFQKDLGGRRNVSSLLILLSLWGLMSSGAFVGAQENSASSPSTIPSTPSSLPSQPQNVPQSQATPSPMGLNWIAGPQSIPSENGMGQIELPDHYQYIHGKDSHELIERLGLRQSSNTFGVMVENEGNDTFVVSFEYYATGHIQDSGASGALESKKLFDTLKKQTPEEVQLTRWEKEPTYNPSSHELNWAVEFNSPQGKTINYTSILLGRQGYVLATVAGPYEDYVKTKSQWESLIKSFHYFSDQAYSAFNPKTDISTTFGLSQMVLGDEKTFEENEVLKKAIEQELLKPRKNAAMPVSAEGNFLLILFKHYWGALLVVILALGYFFKSKGGQRKSSSPSDSKNSNH